MKKSVRLFLSGNIQPMFFNDYIRKNAESLKIRGFLRALEDGRIEIFLEGDSKSIEEMIPLCQKGPFNTKINKVEQRDERFQDFKEFKILKI